MGHRTKISGVARDIIGGRAKINSTTYEISKGRTKVGGVGHDISFGGNSLMLGDIPEGTELKLYNTGIGGMESLLLAEHDYETELNLNGRTLLVNLMGLSEKMSMNTGIYAESDVRKFLQTYAGNTYSDQIKNAIGTTKYRTYHPYGYMETLEDSVFLLSVSELAEPLSNWNAPEDDGTLLCTSGMIQKVWGMMGGWRHTRSPYPDSYGNDVLVITPGGVQFVNNVGENMVCPAFTLPASTPVDPETMEILL